MTPPIPPGRRRRPAGGVRIEARAKLNLGLAVGPRRDDGFHELATIFQSVTLADTLHARRAARGFDLVVRHEDASLGRRGRRRKRKFPRLTTGAGNLVLRAARLVARTFGIDGGARFRLVKRIPIRAGLGGGSADAAATLAAMRALYRIRAPRETWLALAAELGSDVPFALHGGTALGRGRGEILTPARLARPFAALIAVPTWRVSTRVAFSALNRRKYGLTSWQHQIRFAREMIRGHVNAAHAMRMGNTFEGVLGDRKSDYEHLRDRLMRAGAVDARLTGSGSAVFAIPGSGSSAREVAGRFTGSERLYMVRSARTGMRLTMQP